MYKIFRIIFFLILFSPITLSAATDFAADTTPIFNAQEAFNELNNALKVTQEAPNSMFLIKEQVRKLESLSSQAKNCVTVTESKIDNLNSLLKDIQEYQPNEIGQKDLKYLTDKKTLLLQQLADCRLFNYEAQEDLVLYKNIIKKLSTEDITSRTPNLFKSLSTLYDLKSKISTNLKLFFNQNFFIYLILGSVLAFSFFIILESHTKKLYLIAIYKVFIFALWLILGFYVSKIQNEVNINKDIFHSIRIIYAIITYFLIYLFTKFILAKHYLTKYPKVLKYHPNKILIFLFSAIFLIEIFGYHQLAKYLILGLALTILSSIVIIKLVEFINSFFDKANKFDSKFGKKIRDLLDISLNQTIIEFEILKYSILLILSFFYIVIFLRIWGFSENHIDLLLNGFFQGFEIGELKIFPLRIIKALICFCAIFLTGRYISRKISIKLNHSRESDTQVAIASITLYIFFALALIFSLMISGISFTGLAIITGALSVGVGLGLQSIVNNFVSGLILLIEKPIKPGDRVIVGNTEGYVKKIRVRSTQITTITKMDVIVPNAELITNQVTNYTYSNKNCRIFCSVGVAYGSPTETVKKLLLEVANENPQILKIPSSAPNVYFTQFGDSALIFELWCEIADANLKFSVKSDINYGIERKFKEHNIEIAYPQLDVHLHNNAT